VAADNRADNRTTVLLQRRVLKGTDGKGGAYLKDKIYLEGNVACWQAVCIRPEIIEEGDKGKFDTITNLRHIAILRSIGALAQAG
jgi:hypothetical protein